MGAVCLCKAKGILSCPRCKRKLEITRPDSSHPLSSLKKPGENEVEGDVVTQVYTCKNTNCNSEIPVYWYEVKMLSERD